MLTLTRRLRERIRIGDTITVTVIHIQPGQVKLGIDAPPDVPILREEVWRQAPAGHGPTDPMTSGRSRHR